MTSFPSIIEIENMGGNVFNFLFIQCSKVLFIPAVLNSKITTAITLKTGYSWLNGSAIQGSLDFEEKQTKSNHGNTFNPILKGVMPKLTPEVLTLFEEMSIESFVIIVTDNNGNKHLLGNQFEGMKFSFDRNTMALPSGLNGHNFEFSAVRSKPSPFYSI